MRSELRQHATRLNQASLKALAAMRADFAQISAAGWRINLARQFLDFDAETALLKHGAETGLTQAAADLFSGAIVNPSEGRPALHWALRATHPLSGEAEAVRRSVEPAL